MKKTILIKCQGADTLPIDVLTKFQGKLKSTTKKNLDKLKTRIIQDGFIAPFFVWENKGDHYLIDGHSRIEALHSLREDGYDIPFLPVSYIEAADEAQARQRVLAVSSQYGEFDTAELSEWLDALDDDVAETLRLVDSEIPGTVPAGPALEPTEGDDSDEIGHVNEITEPGDLWELNGHRLLCGDSLKAENLNEALGGAAIDLLFTDPPYGMGKEKDGVLNDNMNLKQALEFNRIWLANSFNEMSERGSLYCWGVDRVLMDIYSEIFKPMIADNLITFRNLLTWDKGSAFGRSSAEMRSYSKSDEKCLFIMMGVQGFNNNSDNYFEGWEPLRNYLLESRLAMGWSVPDMKRVVGHSDLKKDHWTGKSQFEFPTQKVYEAMKAEADKLRVKTGNDAFAKEYDAFRKEYEELKKEYDKIKAAAYAERAYFNNTHESMSSVWNYSQTPDAEKKQAGGHATPKPVALCERAIKSSSREGEIVADLFMGGGSTLIACEKLGRICRGLELDPHWCDVIVNRFAVWCKLNSREITIKRNGKIFDYAALSN